jgi:hypothetical protein
MQNAADSGASALPEHHDGDCFGSIVSELSALLDHVQGSIKAIETAIARDVSSESSEHVDNVVVLDDVTPRYAKASAALDACNVSLDAALQFLLDTKVSALLTKSAPRLVLLSDRPLEHDRQKHALGP